MNAWKLAYKFGWATEADLDAAVTQGQITAEEKVQIMAE
ncbi:MAG: XkdX family protein [Syntrophomonas sp.]